MRRVKKDKMGKTQKASLVMVRETSRLRRTLREEIGRVSPRGLVNVERTAALLFCSIHSRVGMLQQFVDGMIVVRINRNSDADANGDVVPLQLERCGDGFCDAFGYHENVPFGRGPF